MTRYPLSAHYVRHTLKLDKLERGGNDLVLWRRERNLLVYKLSETQYVCVYAFGVVVTFGIEDRKERDKYIRRIARGGEDEPGITATHPTEDYPVFIDPEGPESVDFSELRLKKLSIEKLLLVFHVVAQSVAMDYFEHQVDDTLKHIGTIHATLAKKGKISARAKDIMRLIGANGMIVNFVLGQLSLLDKPDNVWEDKDAETLYTSMRKMFELDDRFTTLRFKLSFIQDSTETILETLQHKRSEILEIAIIALFVFEIVMAFIR